MIKSREERLLVAAALLMCALIIGLNAFNSGLAGGKTVTASHNSVLQIQKTEVVSSQAAENNGKININDADAKQLSDFLPGIGAQKAQAIVDYREKIGRFTSVKQLLQVDGIGPKIYNSICDMCIV